MGDEKMEGFGDGNALVIVAARDRVSENSMFREENFRC